MNTTGQAIAFHPLRNVYRIAPDIKRQPADRLGRRQQVRDQGSAVAPALPMEPARRHWHCDGTDPLPTGAEALDEPFSTFLSWFLRITCDRCGKDGLLLRGSQNAGTQGT